MSAPSPLTPPPAPASGTSGSGAASAPLAPGGGPPENLAGLTGFFAGFGAPWAGLRFMNARPRLWRHGVLPVLCNLVLTTALAIGLWFALRWGFGWLDGRFTEGWGWKTVSVLGKVAMVVLALAVSFGAWILFQGILCGWFYSRLAREVEIQLGLPGAAMREVPFVYQVVDAVRDVCWLGFIAVGCLLLNFVPVIGSIASAGVGAYCNCFAFGVEYLDYPQALRARGRSEQMRFARRHRGATLGLGAAALLLSFIPLLGAVLLTTAATGAVLLFRRLDPVAGAKGAPPEARAG